MASSMNALCSVLLILRSVHGVELGRPERGQCLLLSAGDKWGPGEKEGGSGPLLIWVSWRGHTHLPSIGFWWPPSAPKAREGVQTGLGSEFRSLFCRVHGTRRQDVTY
jgi:hypothetical protein